MSESFFQITQFIRQLHNEPKDFIPLQKPIFNGNEKKYLEECIDSTFVSSVGTFVDQFEEKMAEYIGCKKAVVCVNGTNALHIALLIVGVEQDTEVITQPLTFIATANAISYCSAKPVFLDVDMDTMGLSPHALRTWLENNVELRTSSINLPMSGSLHLHDVVLPINKNTNRRISACVPMHTFGHPARIDEIVEICTEYKIPVVEDAAESLGSYFLGQHTGTFGKIGVLSFNGNKIITTGGGGMLLFNDIDLARKAKHLTTQAKVPHPWEFNHDEVGYNYRMPNINAALGLAQLEQLSTFLSFKRNKAQAYKDFFSTLNLHQDQIPNMENPISNEEYNSLNTQQILFITEPQNARSNYWLNCILLPNKVECTTFLKYTNENGIMTRPAWQLMSNLKMFMDCEKDELTNATLLAERLVNLPS